jgi:plasmid maintenance system antidote protein VapI
MSTEVSKEVHMGNRLKHRLKVLSMRPSKLAQDMGVGRQAVAYLLNKAEWQYKTMCKVAHATRVRPSYFLHL